jgi:hypothetical protein
MVTGRFSHRRWHRWQRSDHRPLFQRCHSTDRHHHGKLRQSGRADPAGDGLYRETAESGAALTARLGKTVCNLVSGALEMSTVDLAARW